ncbi:MAG: putative colanic acid biosynthesis acetyltransferase [Bryobacteraceae bacterium]
MNDYSCLADDVDCYTVDRIVLGAHAIVSQYSYLCTATHDYRDPNFALIIRPIVLGDHSWVAARAFIGPGVSIGIGAVVGACSCVTKDVDPWVIVAGNPAVFLKPRTMRQYPAEQNAEDGQ